ncbi:uncharacterized protein EV420DRAFT_1488932 [Desarmillaria tabescens]|uniref:Uncharacterized protein n=1 Tax=Armillaria tabescens TaxID=1929756 RepID=A0AA39J0H6_ARMTA|nr:uncharacterized protein EV420DRAFT_1488932 [Desarmillaria tabescens]KAK0433838.1 hypothetical protein EV420DRAFT_1488932 [Desarmillaria tabescens]
MSYDHVGLCATLEDQISHKDNIYIYCNAKCSVSATADRAFDLWDFEQSQDMDLCFDVFQPRLLPYARHQGHLWHLIAQDLVTIEDQYQDPLSSAYRPRFKYVTEGDSFDCESSGIWTLYHIPSNVQHALRWVKASDFDKESKLLEVIKRTKSEWVVGPLDFCGVSLVQRMGNGQYIHYVKYLGHDALNPAPLTYRLIQDIKYHVMGRICDTVNVAKKNGTWEPGYWKCHGYTLHSAKQGFIKLTKKGTPILRSKNAKLIHCHHVQAQERRSELRRAFKVRCNRTEKELWMVRHSRKVKPVVRMRLSSDESVVLGTSNGQVVKSRLRSRG